jgi:holo-[acyl-carrier protein] synthase
MRIVGHGIDVVRVADIKRKLEAPGGSWLYNVYSSDERAAADGPPVAPRYYAGRFAGKEAVAKALGTGFAGDITWRGIEILRQEGGAPSVRLSDEVRALAESLGITAWVISISHCGDYANASAIALGE